MVVGDVLHHIKKERKIVRVGKCPRGNMFRGMSGSRCTTRLHTLYSYLTYLTSIVICNSEEWNGLYSYRSAQNRINGGPSSRNGQTIVYTVGHKKVRYKLLFLLIGHVSSSATKPQSSQDIFEARWYSFICS